MARKNYGDELWQSLVDAVRDDDELPCFESAGMWTPKKLYFLCQYLEQTTRGMKARRGFPSGLSYIDLFCGSGVSAVRLPGGNLRRYPGSPLIAASTPEPFDRLVLVDIDQNRLDAARNRLKSLGRAQRAHFLLGDSNEIVDTVMQLVPQDSLSIAFIDPYSLDIHFNTIRRLAQQRAVDLIILFSDRFDLGRNVHRYYYPASEHSKLDAFLGCSDWRQQLDSLEDQTGAKVRELFARIYLEQLRQLGYGFAQSWAIDGPQGPVFRLVFASKHRLGLKFCDIALHRDFEGHKGLFPYGCP